MTEGHRNRCVNRNSSSDFWSHTVENIFSHSRMAVLDTTWTFVFNYHYMASAVNLTTHDSRSHLNYIFICPHFFSSNLKKIFHPSCVSWSNKCSDIQDVIFQIPPGYNNDYNNAWMYFTVTQHKETAWDNFSALTTLKCSLTIATPNPISIDCTLFHYLFNQMWNWPPIS